MPRSLHRDKQRALDATTRSRVRRRRRPKTNASDNMGLGFRLFGELATFLKVTWILPSVIFAASVFAVLTARVLLTAEGKPDPAWTPWLVAATVASALAVVFDRIADAYDKKLSKLRLSGSEDSAENSITDLNTFLGEVIEVTFLQGAAKAAHMRWLRRSLVLVAAKSIGPGSRATYYTLEDSTPGHRVLGSPQHATEYGRHDKPSRPFLEEEDPSHSIWQVLDGPDEQVEVMREGVDEVYGVDWGRKPHERCRSARPPLDALVRQPAPALRGPRDQREIAGASIRRGSLGRTARSAWPADPGPATPPGLLQSPNRDNLALAVDHVPRQGSALPQPT